MDKLRELKRAQERVAANVRSIKRKGQKAVGMRQCTSDRLVLDRCRLFAHRCAVFSVCIDTEIDNLQSQIQELEEQGRLGVPARVREAKFGDDGLTVGTPNPAAERQVLWHPESPEDGDGKVQPLVGRSMVKRGPTGRSPNIASRGLPTSTDGLPDPVQNPHTQLPAGVQLLTQFAKGLQPHGQQGAEEEKEKEKEEKHGSDSEPEEEVNYFWELRQRQAAEAAAAEPLILIPSLPGPGTPAPPAYVRCLGDAQDGEGCCL